MTIRVVNVSGMKKQEDRARVCYVGRPFAGWKGHALANPFRLWQTAFDGDTKDEIDGAHERAVKSCLDSYRAWLRERPNLSDDLSALWEECEHGAKSLGCWCTTATVGDGSPVVCHAQILAEILMDRFMETNR